MAREEYRVLRTDNADAPMRTFADGVFAINTDTHRIHVFDGVGNTPGGHQLALLSDIPAPSGSGSFGYYTAADIGLVSDPTHDVAIGNANRDAWLAFENAHASIPCVIDLRSKTPVDYPMTKRVGSSACIRYSPVAVGGGTPETAITAPRAIVGAIGVTKITQIGSGLGSFHCIEIAEGFKDLHVEGVTFQQASIFPWQVSYLTRPTGPAGTYTLTVSGDGVTTTPLAITIAAAEPNDTTINNIVTALNTVVGQNYTATAAGTVGAKYVRVQGNVSAASRFYLATSNALVLAPDNVSEEQLHLIHLKNGNTGIADNERIAFVGCHFYASIGASFKVFGEAGHVSRGVTIENCFCDARNPGIGMGLGGRSCLEFQRGVYDVIVRNTKLQGAKNSCIDFEETATGQFTEYPQANILFENVTIDNVYGSSQVAMSLGGVGPATYTGTASPEGAQTGVIGDMYAQHAAADRVVYWKKLTAPTTTTGWVVTPLLTSASLARNITLRNVQIYEGNVTQICCDDVLFENVIFHYDGNRSASMDTTFGAKPLMYAYQQNARTEFRNCTFWRGPNAPAGMLLQILGAANTVVSGTVPDTIGYTSRRPSAFAFDGCYGYNASQSSAGQIIDCAGLLFTNGNVFEMNRAALDGTANTAFSLGGINHDMTDVSIVSGGLRLVSSGAAKWLYGIGFGFGVTVARKSKNVSVVGLDYGDGLSTVSASACGVVFDLSAGALAAGSGNDPYPIIQACIGGSVKNTWGAANSAAGKVFPIVGGSVGRNTHRMIEGTVTPNANVVGNLGDEYQYTPTTTTSQTWRKDSQAVAGTPDNTGWVQVTIGGGGGLSDADYGDVVVSSGGTTMTVDANVITNAKLATVATATIKGRSSALVGNVEDLTVAQVTAMLNAFVTGVSPLKGLVPSPPPASDNYHGIVLTGDGWIEPLVDMRAELQLVDAYAGNAAFTIVQSGTGATTAIVAGTATRGARLQSTTGTTATGRASRSVSMSGGTATVFGASSGLWCYKMLALSWPVLSDATETYVTRIGFNDSVTGAATDGAYFELDSNASGFLQCVTASNATRTATATALTVAAATDYDFKVIAASDTSVEFYYRLSSSSGAWTLAATHTTNIPSGVTRACSAGVALIKSAGTTARVIEWQTQVVYQVPA